MGSGALGDRAALERLLGGADMAWLVRRVRDRLPQPGDEPLSGIVLLKAPTAAQREAAVNLVGPPRRAGASLRLELGDVEAILRRGPWPPGLADAVVTLTGPVVDRIAARESDARTWLAAQAGLAAAAGPFPGLAEWWDAWCASGGLKRAAGAEARRLGAQSSPAVAQRLVELLARVLLALPGGGVPLGVFARQVVGDAHGLDETRALGRLAGTVVGVAFPSAADAQDSRRDAWARAGVVLSNVSSTVLVLGVRGAASPSGSIGGATATALEAMSTARAPLLLTLDQVRSGGIAAVPEVQPVHVCENPSVVEVVASRWAAHPSAIPAPVLVCTSGQPSTAVVELLEILTAAGAQCRYHGDFDWAGLRIATFLRARIHWAPWRFGAADYLTAAGRVPDSLTLSGDPADASWDPELVPAMVRAGRAVEEEAVIELLAADLVGPRSVAGQR